MASPPPVIPVTADCGSHMRDLYGAGPPVSARHHANIERGCTGLLRSYLKTELRLRPIWHSKDSRIAAHLFIGVLAYHGVHLIRTRLRARGITLSWEFIRHRLCTWVRITTTVREVSGGLIVNRQDVRPSAEVAQIAAAAGVKPQIHRRRQRQLE